VIEGMIFRASGDGQFKQPVVALIDGKQCGEGIFLAGSKAFGGNSDFDGRQDRYSVTVLPDSLESGCGREGATIQVEVGGIPAVPIGGSLTEPPEIKWTPYSRGLDLFLQNFALKAAPARGSRDRLRVGLAIGIVVGLGISVGTAFVRRRLASG